MLLIFLPLPQAQPPLFAASPSHLAPPAPSQLWHGLPRSPASAPCRPSARAETCLLHGGWWAWAGGAAFSLVTIRPDGQINEPEWGWGYRRGSQVASAPELQGGMLRHLASATGPTSSMLGSGTEPVNTAPPQALTTWHCCSAGAPPGLGGEASGA